jgi:hypothetical protein
MRLLATVLFAGFLCLGLTASASAIPLTGSPSDFPPTAFVEDDSGDTELFDCGFGPVDGALDIGEVYCLVERDTIYIGLEYDRFCFCDIQIGIAFHGPGGNNYDPFNRQILWNGECLTILVVYDVIPTHCNDYNYEVIYKADGAGGWTDLGSGPNYWGFVDDDGGNFKEFAIPLALLGLECNDEIAWEAWITQDDFGSGLKPAYDFVFNDAYPAQQKSQAGGPTLWDVPDGEESLPEVCGGCSKDCPVPTETETWGAVKAIYR